MSGAEITALSLILAGATVVGVGFGAVMAWWSHRRGL